MDAETAHILAASGCKGVFFGVESGDQIILDSDHYKGVVNEQVMQAVAHCRKSGMRSTASFIFGAIHDTEKSIENSIDFSLYLQPDYVLYNIYTAHPGTAGYLQAVHEGIIDHYRVDIDRWRGEPVGVPTVCRSVPRRDLLRFKAEAYVRFYRHRDPERYAQLIETYEAEVAQLARGEA